MGPTTQLNLAALFDDDFALLERHFEAEGPPTEQALVDAARLLLRYQGSPTAQAHLSVIQALMDRWELDRDGLFSMCRAIWASQWRPSVMEQQEAVGSGADVGAEA